MAGVGDVSAADVEAREYFLGELVPGGAGGCSVWAVEALPACVREVCQGAGVDEGYLSRWPVDAWVEWSRALEVFSSGGVLLRPDAWLECPVLPGWMRPLVRPWRGEFDVPFPCVARVSSSGHDWFAEAGEHPESFRLSMTFFGIPGVPSVAEVEEAWRWAAGQGLSPVLSMSLVPAAPWGQAVVGAVEALCVDGPSEEQVDVLASFLGRSRLRRNPLEGFTARRPVAWEWAVG